MRCHTNETTDLPRDSQFLPFVRTYANIFVVLTLSNLLISFARMDWI